MASNSNIWPSGPIVVAPQVRRIIERFFDISDSIEKGTGLLFAQEIFTEDGFFKTHETCVFKGHKEIAATRNNLPATLASRAHELLHVFAANSPATDLVVLGRFTLGQTDGTFVTMDFTARFIVTSGTSDSDTKVKFLQVWTDPTEMIAAKKRAEEALAAKSSE